MPHAVLKTQIYPLQHVIPAVTGPKLSGIISRWGGNFALIASILHGSFFWYTQQLYFQHTLLPYISHGTNTIMIQYDTGRTEIPFGLFDVCIWVSPFLAHGSPIEGTPHQCPFCGIFAEPLN
jgi:hypothetical protein